MEEEARTWIGLMLGEPFGEGESFSDGLKNGVRLCRLANIVQPGSIPKFSLEPKMAIKERENITLFIQALKRFGIKDFECFSTLDLAEGQNTKAVVVAIHALGRLCQGPEYSAHEDWPKLGKQVLAKNVRGMPRKAASLALALHWLKPACAHRYLGSACSHFLAHTSHLCSSPQTRVFTEKQLHEATAAVSVLNLGSSSMAKTAAASLLSGQAIAVSATTEAGAAGGSSAPSSSSAAAETVAATAATATAVAATAAAATPAAAAPSASSSAAAAAPQATAAAQQDPAAPEGWLAKVSKSTGKTYYQHKATGKTVWTLPTEADA
jgi:hypothetical protein